MHGWDRILSSSDILVIFSPLHVKSLMARIRNFLKALGQLCTTHQMPTWKKYAAPANIIINHNKIRGTNHVRGLQYVSALSDS